MGLVAVAWGMPRVGLVGQMLEMQLFTTVQVLALALPTLVAAAVVDSMHPVAVVRALLFYLGR